MPQPLVIELDVPAQRLRCGDAEVAFGHHAGALFLAALMASAQQGRALDWTGLLHAWRWHHPQAKPDRTAVTRALNAVQAAIKALLPGEDTVMRIQHHPRGKTVGPWHWRPLPGEVWRVVGDVVELPVAPHCMVLAPDWSQWAEVANALMIADHLLQRGQYDECEKALHHGLDTLPLTPESRCLWLMRLMQCTHRNGQPAAAQHWHTQARALVGALPDDYARHVQADLDLMQARWAYDANPVRAMRRWTPHALDLVVGQSPSPTQLALAGNLKALMLRRQGLVGDAASARAGLDGMTHAAMHAYFWASVARDVYLQQALAVNMGWLLNRCAHHGLCDSWQASLDWFALGWRLTERFDLPQDSAWDFLMTAQAHRDWLMRRAPVHPQEMTWPDAVGPETERFYQRGLALARSHGSVRQLIAALELQAWFHDTHNNPRKAKAMRRELKRLSKQHPELAADLLRED